MSGGKCPGGTCPGGLCPRTTLHGKYAKEIIMYVIVRCFLYCEFWVIDIFYMR